MKTFITSAATAIVSLCGIVFIATKALELPMVIESVWSATRWLAYEPLLLAAIMLTIILIVGRAVDIVHRYNENRQEEAARPQPAAA